ncbi:phytanoyl-CoA dioxygenase family protein [Streptomyces sp. NPDC058676]|uniref:phytanoyl-CoA dioxygenase family protein n=1 Tax=unclassified Streptomyces TaxID=2593676 RepID=UPI00364DC864
MDAESGATLVWPGSHRHREPEPQVHVAVPVRASPGSVLFLHCLTAHRASTNMTARHRSIINNDYKSADHRADAQRRRFRRSSVAQRRAESERPVTEART